MKTILVLGLLVGSMNVMAAKAFSSSSNVVKGSGIVTTANKTTHKWCKEIDKVIKCGQVYAGPCAQIKNSNGWTCNESHISD